MTRIGTVNYHVHSPNRQAFELDAGGVVGNLISPELVETPVAVLDARSGETQATFEADGLVFASAPTQVLAFSEDRSWQSQYETELTALLTSELQAKEVVVFDHTVRVDDPNAVRKPARNVHSDYSREGAETRLRDILGSDRAAAWSRGHYAFVNVWRPIGQPINSAPLGFIRPASVSEDDWILIDLIYPDRRGHILGLAANDQHEWIYKSRMTPDEVALFNIYDNRGKPGVAHSAIDMIEDTSVHVMRKSIESRTVVRL